MPSLGIKPGAFLTASTSLLKKTGELLCSSYLAAGTDRKGRA